MSFRRRAALAFLRFAQQLLPPSRLDWSKAMRAELDSLRDDRDALAWSVGCVTAGFKERMSTVFNTDLKISRWVLVPEMLLCFVPLTLGWLDAIGGSSGIVRLNADVIQRYFLAAPGGTIALFTMAAAAVLGAVGPLGLATALRVIVVGRSSSSRWSRAVLVGGPILCGVLTLAARVAIAGPGALGFKASDSFDFWSGIVLLAVLPSLGAVHMFHLAPRKARQSFAGA